MRTTTPTTRCGCESCYDRGSLPESRAGFLHPGARSEWRVSPVPTSGLPFSRFCVENAGPAAGRATAGRLRARVSAEVGVRTTMKFEELGLRPELLRAVDGAGYVTPTPIQARVVPAALDGKDLIACAQTGTGKTAAFLLPILQRLAAGRASRGPRALVVTPTRELAAQIGEATLRYGRHLHLRSTVIYGGGRHGAAEAAPARGPGSAGRDARTVARPSRPTAPGARRRRDRRPRRGGPHARHGLPAGHAAHPGRAAGDAAEPVLLRHDAGRDRGAHSPDDREPDRGRGCPPGDPGRCRQAGRAPGSRGLQEGPAGRAAAAP